MAVVWILEKPSEDKTELTVGLIGDFAVRAFASIKSFLRLSESDVTMPDFILISTRDFGDEWENLLSICQLRWSNSRIYFFRYFEEGKSLVPNELEVCIRLPSDLSFYLQKHCSRNIDRKGSIQIQIADIVVDNELPRIRMVDSERWIDMTHREAAILKTLLQHSETFLSYEDICELVWRGVKVSPKSVSSHISRIRRYLSSSKITIENVYGGGYQLTLNS